MKRPNKEIDKLFSKGLRTYEEAPSADGWAQLESKLPSNRNRTIYWVAASVAGVLLTAAIAWNNILNKSDISLYDSQQLATQANFPQREYIPVPILVQTNTIVYVDRPVRSNERVVETSIAKNTSKPIEIQSALELEPVGSTYAFSNNIALPKIDFTDNIPASVEDDAVTIIYKKGDPKHPKLAKAFNFMKEVGEGERQLIDFEKISNNLMARRETNNHSNKN